MWRLKQVERRAKYRFPLRRDMRYKLLEDGEIVESGLGSTLDLSSSGVAFQIGHPLVPGTFIELAISWPVLLNDDCPMRLVIYGRVVRCWGMRSSCTVEKYEFRTQSQHLTVARLDSKLQRWADGIRKESLKAAGF